MSFLSDFLYFATLTLMVCHELDAMQHHEWRVLPLTSSMPDDVGRQLFLWIHIPLFMAIFWFGNVDGVAGFRFGFCIFAVAHAFLHWFFRNHPKYEFDNLTSWALIVGCGLAGAVYVLVS